MSRSALVPAALFSLVDAHRDAGRVPDGSYAAKAKNRKRDPAKL